LIGWPSAAFKCKVRGRWIGWPPFLQDQRLSFTVDKHHGRLEIRQIRTSTDLNHDLEFPCVGQVFLAPRRCVLPELPNFPSLFTSYPISPHTISSPLLHSLPLLLVRRNCDVTLPIYRLVINYLFFLTNMIRINELFGDKSSLYFV